jgi:hypothetical protein
MTLGFRPRWEDGKMRSEWILGRLTGSVEVDPVDSGEVPVAGSCKYGDELSSSGATELVTLVILI